MLLCLLLSSPPIIKWPGSVTRLSSEINCLEALRLQTQQHSSRGRPARSTQSSSDDDTNTKSRTSAPLAPTSFPDKTISSTSLKPYQIT